MTLLEVIVVVAIALVLTAVVATGLTSIFSLRQRTAASEIATTYQLLREEAVLRNQTFRIAYHIDGNWYQVEVGEPGMLISANEDQRLEYERERASKLSRFADEEGANDDMVAFAAYAAFRSEKVELPRGTVFGGVQTPQYDDIVRPSGVAEDPDDPLIVYSYVFPTGFTEPTIVQLVDEDDSLRGFTVIVEAMTGSVRLASEVVQPRDAFADRPDQGPDFPQ